MPTAGTNGRPSDATDRGEDPASFREDSKSEPRSAPKQDQGDDIIYVITQLSPQQSSDFSCSHFCQLLAPMGRQSDATDRGEDPASFRDDSKSERRSVPKQDEGDAIIYVSIKLALQQSSDFSLSHFC